MVEHEIDDKLDAAVMARLDKLVKIVERTECRINVVIIIDVILVVGLRRHDRRQPDTVNTEIVTFGRVAVVEVVEL